MGYSTVGGLSWEDIKAKLESEGAKNKQYDSDLDAIIDLATIPTPLTGKDADTVDGYHGEDFEKVANKGVANGYCELDANEFIPSTRIPKASSITLHDDSTVHTTTSTTYVTLHSLESPDYDFLIGSYRIKFLYRTTGAATAYVLSIVRARCGTIAYGILETSSTTSTTTVLTAHYPTDYQAYVFYGDSAISTFILQFRTSDSAVPAEVSEEIIEVAWGKLVVT